AVEGRRQRTAHEPRLVQLVASDRPAEPIRDREQHTVVRTDENRAVPGDDRDGAAVRPDTGVDDDQVNGIVRRLDERLGDDERTTADTAEAVHDVDPTNA